MNVPNLDLPYRFNITLRLYTGPITPNIVSQILGIDGTSAVSAEAIQEPLGAYRYRLGRLNGWFLSSEDRVASRDPRQHLDWFSATVAPLAPKIPQVLQAPEAQGSVNVLTWSNDGSAVELQPSDLQVLASLGLPVWLSFAAYGGDEDALD